MRIRIEDDFDSELENEYSQQIMTQTQEMVNYQILVEQ